MLGTLHSGGVSILEALELVSGAVGNLVYENALIQVREGVREGDMIGSRLAETGVFTPIAVHMVSVGEESGNLDGMLSRLSDICDFDADNRLKKAMSLLEPSIILVMGVFIAFIIIAVLLPIFDLNSSMTTS
jgi:type II secretory pathway component PulF